MSTWCSVCWTAFFGWAKMKFSIHRNPIPPKTCRLFGHIFPSNRFFSMFFHFSVQFPAVLIIIPLFQLYFQFLKGKASKMSMSKWSVVYSVLVYKLIINFTLFLSSVWLVFSGCQVPGKDQEPRKCIIVKSSWHIWRRTQKLRFQKWNKSSMRNSHSVRRKTVPCLGLVILNNFFFFSKLIPKNFCIN